MNLHTVSEMTLLLKVNLIINHFVAEASKGFYKARRRDQSEKKQRGDDSCEGRNWKRSAK